MTSHPDRHDGLAVMKVNAPCSLPSPPSPMSAPPPQLDTSDPSIRSYLLLTRLQVLTPLTLLINIAATVVCSAVAEPGIKTILYTHPTSLTPNSNAIASYIAAVYVCLIGYCVMLSIGGRKEETKHAMIQGVGYSLIFANFTMALWSVAFFLQWFLISTILIGLLIVILVFSNLSLMIYHAPARSRPLDTLLIHAPMRFFLVLPLSLVFELCLFITLRMTFHPTPTGQPQNYADWHATEGFLVVLLTNLVSLVVIVLRHDLVWCIAATWICLSVWSETPKPAGVYITEMVFTFVHPISLIVAVVYGWMHRHHKEKNRIRLPDGDDAHPGLYEDRAAA